MPQVSFIVALLMGIDTTILRNVMDSVQDTIMNINFRHLIL